MEINKEGFSQLELKYLNGVENKESNMKFYMYLKRAVDTLHGLGKEGLLEGSEFGVELLEFRDTVRSDGVDGVDIIVGGLPRVEKEGRAVFRCLLKSLCGVSSADLLQLLG